MSEVEIHLVAYDEASEKIESVGNTVSATFTDIEGKTQSLTTVTDESTGQITASYGKVADAGQNLEKQQAKTTMGFSDSALAANNLALSGATLFMSFERVEKAEVAVDRANLNVQRSTEAVDQAQKAYNAAVAKYGENSAQAKDAADKLAIAQEAHNVALERAGMASQNLNQAMIFSALTVIPSLISIITSVSHITEIWQGVQAGLNAVMNANPIFLVITAVSLLVVGIITAYNACEPFRNAINAIGKALGDFFKPAIDAVKGALEWLWNNILVPLGSFLSAMLTYDIKVVGDAFNWLAGVLKPVTDALGAVANAVGGAWNAAVGAIGGAVSAIGGFFGNVADASNNLSKGVTADTGEMVVGLEKVGDSLGPFSGAFDAMKNVVLGFTGETKEYYEAWRDEQVKLVDENLSKQLDIINKKYDEQLKTVDDSLSKQVEEINKKYDDMTKTVNDAFDKEYAEFIKHYAELLEPPVSALDKLLEKYNSYFDKQIADLTRHYDEETKSTTSHYDGLISDVERSLNEQKRFIEADYSEMLRTVQQEYADEIAATRAHYDDMIGAVNAGLKQIQNARKGDLDALELNMLLEKEKLKAALAANEITQDEYQKKVSELEKTYNAQRAETNDAYRLKELEYQKAHAGEVEALEKEKGEKLKELANKEKDAVTDINAEKNEKLLGAETAANAKIAALNQEKTDKLKAIADQEKDALTKIEEEKNTKIKEIQDRAAALEKEHADNIAAIEKSKNEEINAVTTAAENAKAALIASREGEIKNTIQAAELEKQRIISESGEKLEASNQNVWSSIGGAISNACASASTTLQSWAKSVADAMSGAWDAISKFIGSICFAHALANAADSSQKTMAGWVGMVQDSMEAGLGSIKAFNRQAELSGAVASAGAGAAPVPSAALAGARAPVTVNITAPLVNVEGSADRATVDLASKQVLETLKTVIVEPTSASAVQKRIRKGAVFA